MIRRNFLSFLASLPFIGSAFLSCSEQSPKSRSFGIALAHSFFEISQSNKNSNIQYRATVDKNNYMFTIRNLDNGLYSTYQADKNKMTRQEASKVIYQAQTSLNRLLNQYV